MMITMDDNSFDFLSWTKDDFISHFRKMYNFRADKTQELGRVYSSNEYFCRPDSKPVPNSLCYLCQYTDLNDTSIRPCDSCPIDWTSTGDTTCTTIYRQLLYEHDACKAASIMRTMANMPEKE